MVFKTLSCLEDNWKRSKCPKIVVGFMVHSCKRIKNDAIFMDNRKIPKVSSSKNCMLQNNRYSTIPIDPCN